MRDQLRATADDGMDRLKDRARAALEALEHRDELVQAGKEHLKLALESGRAAYRTSVDSGARPKMSTTGAIGVLAAAVVTGYHLVRGMRIGAVAPKVEDLLDTSRDAVAKTAREITQVASTGLQVLRQVEEFLRARRPEAE